MSPNEHLVERLFSSLARGDFRSAGDCYCGDAMFKDIAFDLKGRDDITAMWHLVCSKDTKVSFRDIRADDRNGTAHWDALYRFSKTGRLVHNRIHSTFTFQNGTILVHHDHSNRWIWARQALGPLAAIPLTSFPFILRWIAARELKAFRDRLPKAPTVVTSK
jgi:ketosteroid isomerase-like protein